MLPEPLLDDWLRAALREDLGTGDLTCEALIDPGQWGRAELVAKEPLVVAALGVGLRVFGLLGEGVRAEARVQDGDRVEAGTVLASVTGPLKPLLEAERVALNVLQHVTGVATLTRRFVDAVAGTGVRILDTRKTLPGFRALEKYAVRVGGGHNHRASLSEGALIKENHILAAGGVARAVRRMKRDAPHLLRVEVEATTPEEVREAVEAGADVILLDNMRVEVIREVAASVGGAVPLEVSGGVTLETVRALAETGVDAISVGALTHSARAADISMLVRETWVPDRESACFEPRS